MLEDFLRKLQKSSAQSGTKGWCQVESTLIYVEKWYLARCVIVLFMVCFMICMCTIFVVNYFVNLNLSKEFRKYVHVLPNVFDVIEVIDITS